jgi:CheY-like chemotaxis protein
MDVQMPVMDGFQATAAIRKAEIPGGKHVPIIAMTAHALRGDSERCLAAGMDDYIAKPIRREALDEVIKRWSGVSSAAQPPFSRAGSLASLSALKQAMHEPSKMEAIAGAPEAGDASGGGNGAHAVDIRDALRRVGGDRAFLANLYRDFLSSLPERLSQISAAVAGADAEAVRLAAHSLKGAAAGIGALEISGAAIALERAASSADMGGSEEAVGKLAKAAQALPDAAREAGLEIRQ